MGPTRTFDVTSTVRHPLAPELAERSTRENIELANGSIRNLTGDSRTIAASDTENRGR